MIRYILYDLDGVLVDACDWHYHALNKALDKFYGFTIPYDEHLRTYNGLPTKKKIEILIQKKLIPPVVNEDLFLEKQNFTKQEIIKNSSADNEKIELHSTLLAKGFRLACVTNAIRETAELMLDRTGQLRFMKFIICNEDVVHPKPDPMPYIAAMNRFSALPSETLIIEDSDKGFQSAKGSGAWVYRVANSKGVVLKNVLECINKYE